MANRKNLTCYNSLGISVDMVKKTKKDSVMAENQNDPLVTANEKYSEYITSQAGMALFFNSNEDKKVPYPAPASSLGQWVENEFGISDKELIDTINHRPSVVEPSNIGPGLFGCANGPK